MEEEAAGGEKGQQVLKVLELLKKAAQEIRSNPSLNSSESNSSNSFAINALLELETESDSILSTDPNLSNLSLLLSQLKSLIQAHDNYKPQHGLKSYLTHRVNNYKISRVANLIESEIQSWIDRETILNLAETLRELHFSESSSFENEENLITLLSQFSELLARGFNIELQDLLLRSRIFLELEWVLCGGKISKRVREKVACALKELVLFNKDVFVGQVLVGQTIKALVSMGSLCSLEVLISLIRGIRSPLVDEIESVGGILKILGYLNSEVLEIKIAAMECILEIGYYGRKEAIEAMLSGGVIKKLVELQRSELGGDLIDLGEGCPGGRGVGVGGCEMKYWGGWRRIGGGSCKERKYLVRHPFASIVARFAVQLEVGEGLRQREKRAFKQEVLSRIREAAASDAEAATIVAEVLWGSSP